MKSTQTAALEPRSLRRGLFSRLSSPQRGKKKAVVFERPVPATMSGSSELKPRGPFTGSHMLNVKNARLRSEHDVNLLRNRLERLRMEERKALKRLRETRRRADQIVSLKTRNEENHMRKLLEAEYANQQLRRARQRCRATVRACRMPSA